nr:hypothetical protein Iba_chr09cCG14210 [Ipomoea batatas]
MQSLAKREIARSGKIHKWLELIGQSKKPIESIEGDVGDVADVDWAANVHVGRDVIPLNAASHQRLPQRRHQHRKNRALSLGVASASAFPPKRCRRRPSGSIEKQPRISPSPIIIIIVVFLVILVLVAHRMGTIKSGQGIGFGSKQTSHWG